MSRSVSVPTSLSPSTIGTMPTSSSRMMFAASTTVESRPIARGFSVIASRTVLAMTSSLRLAVDRLDPPVRERQDFLAVALPPLRPAAFFCAVVPPWLELLRDELDEPDFFPPRLDAPGEFAILAARSFDMPLSFNASYCFSFFTFARLPPGIDPTLLSLDDNVREFPRVFTKKTKRCDKICADARA